MFFVLVNLLLDCDMSFRKNHLVVGVPSDLQSSRTYLIGDGGGMTGGNSDTVFIGY